MNSTQTDAASRRQLGQSFKRGSGPGDTGDADPLPRGVSTGPDVCWFAGFNGLLPFFDTRILKKAGGLVKRTRRKDWAPVGLFSIEQMG
jgi:hypothetical protein